MKKHILFFLLVFLLGNLVGIFYKYLFDEFSYYPGLVIRGYMNNGLINQIDVVPDEKTALRIAKTIWLPLYGKKNLVWYSYKAVLVNEEIWSITGSKKIYDYLGIRYGGGPYIEIEKKTGHILNIGHYGTVSKF